MASTMVMSGMEVTESISKIKTSEAQREAEQTPSEPIQPAQPRGNYDVDESVRAAFPVPGTTIVHAQNYGMSLWGKTAKVIVELPSGEEKNYFLKVVTLGATGKHMCEGEFESLKAIHSVSPGFVPEPYAWGKYTEEDPETYFLLAEFRDVGKQPASPIKLAAGLANLHKRSVSPTGKFGFHMATCHAKIAQAVNTWEDSWCALYTGHLGHVMDLAKPILQWSEFDVVCRLTLEKVVPRLLLPLQSDGRVIKPCLVHGNCWDGNTALDQRTGDAFVFDVCSFYGHSEYDTGNWRAPRHRLSNKTYIREYKSRFPVSPPEDDWDARNILYSLTFNIGNTIYIPGSSQRQVVYDDMTTLCKMFCANDLKQDLKSIGSIDSENEQATAGMDADEEDGEEELEEEEEEEEEDLTSAVPEVQTNDTTFPPVRACIFDVDGLLINSEDIYTDIYNNILHSYGKPDLPWSIKARQQSRGREGMLQLLDWAQLPITYDEWTAKVSAQYELFKTCTPLPGVPQLLSDLSSKTDPAVHMAIASSATSKTFRIKISHLPSINSAFPQECRVFGDDAAMSEARKKPMPDVFLLALGRINAHLGLGEREVGPEECLVFEDSVAGVEAGRRAGMRVCWVPHKGLREVWRGREGRVLEGKSEEEEKEKDTNIRLGEGQKDKESEEQSHLWSEDGWAEMLMCLEVFDYEYYGIRLDYN